MAWDGYARTVSCPWFAAGSERLRLRVASTLCGVDGCRSRGGFFFFQAEDGIRDIGVTGVQTCALPIWIQFAGGFFVRNVIAETRGMNQTFALVLGLILIVFAASVVGVLGMEVNVVLEIGRASCRERV